MPSRVLALLLALVLFWSGFGFVEAPLANAQPIPVEQSAAVDVQGQLAVSDGSVEHHHLDDQPSQAQSDTPVDMPGLVSTRIGGGMPMPATSAARGLLSAALGSPYLAGLLRPPCLQA